MNNKNFLPEINQGSQQTIQEKKSKFNSQSQSIEWEQLINTSIPNSVKAQFSSFKGQHNLSLTKLGPTSDVSYLRNTKRGFTKLGTSIYKEPELQQTKYDKNLTSFYNTLYRKSNHKSAFNTNLHKESPSTNLMDFAELFQDNSTNDAGIKNYFTEILKITTTSFHTQRDMIPPNRQQTMDLRDWLFMMIALTKEESVNLSTRELAEKIQLIYATCMKELIKQVSVECYERGELMQLLWDFYVELINQILRCFHQQTQEQEKQTIEHMKRIQLFHDQQMEISKQKQQQIMEECQLIKIEQEENNEITNQTKAKMLSLTNDMRILLETNEAYKKEIDSLLLQIMFLKSSEGQDKQNDQQSDQKIDMKFQQSHSIVQHLLNFQSNINEENIKKNRKRSSVFEKFEYLRLQEQQIRSELMSQNVLPEEKIFKEQDMQTENILSNECEVQTVIQHETTNIEIQTEANLTEFQINTDMSIEKMDHKTKISQARNLIRKLSIDQNIKNTLENTINSVEEEQSILTQKIIQLEHSSTIQTIQIMEKDNDIQELRGTIAQSVEDFVEIVKEKRNKIKILKEQRNSLNQTIKKIQQNYSIQVDTVFEEANSQEEQKTDNFDDLNEDDQNDSLINQDQKIIYEQDEFTVSQTDRNKQLNEEQDIQQNQYNNQIQNDDEDQIDDSSYVRNEQEEQNNNDVDVDIDDIDIDNQDSQLNNSTSQIDQVNTSQQNKHHQRQSSNLSKNTKNKIKLQKQINNTNTKNKNNNNIMAGNQKSSSKYSLKTEQQKQLQVQLNQQISEQSQQQQVQPQLSQQKQLQQLLQQQQQQQQQQQVLSNTNLKIQKPQQIQIRQDQNSKQSVDYQSRYKTNSDKDSPMNEGFDQDDSNVGINSRDERVKNILAQYKDEKFKTRRRTNINQFSDQKNAKKFKRIYSQNTEVANTLLGDVMKKKKPKDQGFSNLQLQKLLNSILSDLSKQQEGYKIPFHVCIYDFFKNKYGFKQVAEKKIRQVYQFIYFEKITNQKTQLLQKLCSMTAEIDETGQKLMILSYLFLLTHPEVHQHKTDITLSYEIANEFLQEKSQIWLQAHQISQLQQHYKQLQSQFQDPRKMFINLDEFQNRILELYLNNKKDLQSILESLFQAADLDGNNLIEYSEFKALFRAIHANSDADKLQLFLNNADYQDENGDKMITLPRFTEMSIEMGLFSKQAVLQYGEGSEELNQMWESQKNVIKFRFLKSQKYQKVKHTFLQLEKQLANQQQNNQRVLWMSYKLLNEESQRVMLNYETKQCLIELLPFEFLLLKQCYENVEQLD